MGCSNRCPKVPRGSATRTSLATIRLPHPPTRISCASGAAAELAHSLQVAARVPTSTLAPPMADRSASPASSRRVYSFARGRADGTRDMRDVLGGKGANLAEMTNLGIPVPPGFTIACSACTEYLATGAEPAGLRDEVGKAVAALSEVTERSFGSPETPLLVSVRSGAPVS